MLIIQYLYKKASSGHIHGGYVPKTQTSKVSKEKRKCSLSSKSSEEIYEYYDDTRNEVFIYKEHFLIHRKTSAPIARKRSSKLDMAPSPDALTEQERVIVNEVDDENLTSKINDEEKTIFQENLKFDTLFLEDKQR